MGSGINIVTVWQNKLEGTGEDVFDAVESILFFSASKWPQEFLKRRSRIAEALFTSPKKLGCSIIGDDQLEFAKPTNSNGKEGRHIIRIPIKGCRKPNNQQTVDDQEIPKVVPLALADDESIKLKNCNKRQVVQALEVNLSKSKVQSVEKELNQQRNVQEKPKVVRLHDEKSFELKLEASKRKLEERYEEFQSSKKKIKMLDLKELLTLKQTESLYKGRRQAFSCSNMRKRPQNHISLIRGH